MFCLGHYNHFFQGQNLIAQLGGALEFKFLGSRQHLGLPFPYDLVQVLDRPVVGNGLLYSDML